jgi:sterol desaturase/sphingolipid hydroxylase (fatty acid hydroxylase superfamily)
MSNLDGASGLSVLGLSEAGLRLVAFAGAFLILAALESALPKRRLLVSKWRRWATNVGIVAIGSLLVRLMGALSVPLIAVGAAFIAADHGIGLFNTLQWPPLLEDALAIVAFDFALWLQHVATHKVPLLWRLHQVHHADRDIDLTTGIRFHPVEIALSMLWKVAWVFALGASPLAVVIFEVILNAGSMFNHANIDLPRPADRLLRMIIVTPDMHRIHHSIDRREHDTNYGFNLSIWDRLFRTYTAQPALGHAGMTIGLPRFQTEQPLRLVWSLMLPFTGRSGR